MLFSWHDFFLDRGGSCSCASCLDSTPLRAGSGAEEPAWWRETPRRWERVKRRRAAGGRREVGPARTPAVPGGPEGSGCAEDLARGGVFPPLWGGSGGGKPGGALGG